MLQHHIEAIFLIAVFGAILVSVGLLERKHRANYRELVDVLQKTRKELEASKEAHSNDRQKAGIMAALLATAAEGIDPSYDISLKAAQVVSYVGIALNPRLRVRTVTVPVDHASEQDIDNFMQQLTEADMGLLTGQQLALEVICPGPTEKKIEALAIYAERGKSFIYRLVDKDVRCYAPKGHDEKAGEWLIDSYVG